MYTKQITWFGRSCTVACDGNCSKAWGIQNRPAIGFDSKDADDNAMLADGELGTAPADPGTYEGDCAKPSSPQDMNKWCSRECERSQIFEQGEEVKVREFSRRLFNQPWKHTELQ